MTKMYIAVLDDFPDFMVPTLVAHAVLGYRLQVSNWLSESYLDNKYLDYVDLYYQWEEDSFKKVVLRVNQKEFDKISQLENVGLFHENNTLEGKTACAVIVVDDEVPNVLKFGKTWKPKEN